MCAWGYVHLRRKTNTFIAHTPAIPGPLCPCAPSAVAGQWYVSPDPSSLGGAPVCPPLTGHVAWGEVTLEKETSHYLNLTRLGMTNTTNVRRLPPHWMKPWTQPPGLARTGESPKEGLFESGVLLFQLFQLSARGSPLQSRFTDLLLDDLKVYCQLFHLLFQSLVLSLLTLTLGGGGGG